MARKTRVTPMSNAEQSEEDGGDDRLVSRGCRDIPMLVLFILFVGGMGYVTYRALSSGNPYRLIYGVDSWGNICNQKNEKIENVLLSGRDMTDKGKTFYFNPMHFSSMVPGNPLMSSVFEESPVICVESCPDKELLSLSSYRDETGVWLCRYNVPSYSFNKDECPGLPVTSHMSILNRCIPNAIVTLAKAVTSSLGSVFSSFSLGGETAEKITSDVKDSWKELCYLCSISIAVGLIIVVLLRFLAALIIWSMVLLMGGLSLTANAYCWYTWFSLKTDLDSTPVSFRTEAETSKAETWLIYAGIASGVVLIVLLLLLIMRKRIGLVVQLFKEAARALKSCPFLLVQPLWTLLVLIVAVAGLVFISLYVETSGLPTVTKDSGYVKYKFDDVMKYLRLYHYFGVLWITAFIVACQEMVIAGAIVRWYFARDKKSVGWPIFSAIYKLIRYHLGSVAFGSFIIAVVRMVRLILGYVQGRLQGKTSKLAEYLMKILQCCLWCFEKLLKFINRNAYIEMAIHGYGFCRGARKAFTLLVNNAVRVAAINSVGDFVLFISKLFAVGIVVLIGNELLKAKDLHYIWVPLTIAGLLAFVIAHMFMSVYEMTIDTIFICFCEDIEENDGVIKPYYMSTELMVYMSAGERKQRKMKITVSPRVDGSSRKGAKENLELI